MKTAGSRGAESTYAAAGSFTYKRLLVKPLYRADEIRNGS